jgi:hypothetical protein
MALWRTIRCGAVAAVAALASVGAPAAQGAIAPPVITVSDRAVGRIPAGFLGLSMEIRGVEAYTGFDSNAINPVFEQLVRNLDPDQRPVLRLGGDTEDWTWYPIAHMTRPLGVRYALTPTWFKVVRSLARALDAHLIVGVNLEVNSARVAAVEARAIISGIGSPWLQALELGNEPELYNVLAWYAINNVPHYGRPPGWGFSDFLSNYAAIARALPDFPLAGPEVGNLTWVNGIGQFLSDEPRVRIVTVHRYPLGCDPSIPATIPELLSDASTRDFTAGFEPALAAAHAHGASIRLDETNAVSCGGQPGLSNSFAAALWSLDEAFELARAGFSGLNVHVRQGSNELFAFRRTHGRWEGDASPQYYGLLAFARAAPPNSALLDVSGASSGPIHAWATRASNRVERVVLINMATRVGRTVELRAGAAGQVADLERLSAPSVGATGHAKLGGQSFGAETSTGKFAGTPRITALKRSAGGGYRVWMPAASAAILTLARGQRLSVGEGVRSGVVGAAGVWGL